MSEVNFTIPPVERAYYLHKLGNLENQVRRLREAIETGKYGAIAHGAIGSNPAVIEPIGRICAEARELRRSMIADQDGWYYVATSRCGGCGKVIPGSYEFCSRKCEEAESS